MEKTFKQKNFNNLVWTPLGSRVNIYINFCLQVHQVHLDSRISPRIFEKILNGLNGILWGGGETDS
jgi:hypothetical protein